MTSRSRGVAVIALSCLVASCATMNETQCRSTNWYDQGQYDGLLGQQAKFDQYAYQCGKYQLQPAERDYMAGWADGYAEYSRRVSGTKM